MSEYQSKMNLKDTQIAIKLLKDTFEEKLSNILNLHRVSAPLFVLRSSGLNDDLNGFEKPVSFNCKYIDNDDIEIVQSLAKWKRSALKRYNFSLYEGLYTDMNAIRKDEIMDNLHSIYVDQWDWEKIIDSKDRNLDFLYKTVYKITEALKQTEDILVKHYPFLERTIIKDIKFISSFELEDKYPTLTRKQREYTFCKENKVVFISKIGLPLKDNKPHDGRSPDYDDWELNGDLLVYSSFIDAPIEISSMGIRVDSKSLYKQLSIRNMLFKLNFPYHKQVINNELPYTIGGGIGQSRICMLMLNKKHIGEVQASVWDDETLNNCKKENIELL